MAIWEWHAKKRKHKKVKLCNVYMCRTVTGNDIIRLLEGMGIIEWKRYMSYVFSDAVVKALELGENSADITRMFSCDLVYTDVTGVHTKKQKELRAFLIGRLFKVVSETEEEMVVSINLNVLK